MNTRLHVWRFLVAVLNGRDPAKVAALVEQACRAGPSRWTYLISFANEQLVTAPLWSALRRCGRGALVSADAADYLRSFHSFNNERNKAILAQFYEFVGALNSSGIEPMPLKGLAYLVANVFPETGDRYLSDIDLLVPEDAVEVAQRILLDLGYGPSSTIDYSRHHHLVPMIRADRPVAIELHRAPVPRYAERALPTAELWAQSQQCAAGGVRTRLAAPTDAAMLSFLHSRVVDRDGRLLLMPLRLFYDAHVLDQRYGPLIDWRRNLDQASRVGVAGSLRRYLYALREIAGVETNCGSSLGDVAHFAICKTAIAWPMLANVARRLDARLKRADIGRQQSAKAV
jgi:hypothetical protein